jgi:hypothetical protein
VGNFATAGLSFFDHQRMFLSFWDHESGDDAAEHTQLDGACVTGRRPQPLFVDWEFEDIDERVTQAIRAAAATPSLDIPGGFGGAAGPGIKSGWLEAVEGSSPQTFRVRPVVPKLVEGFASLATHLLPDFIEGEVLAKFPVPDWPGSASVLVQFQEPGEQPANSVADVGRGAARWIAAAIQIALHVIQHREDIVRDGNTGTFSGHVLFIDEPEAHLHPAAVSSIVRWCQKMVRLGFNVVVASHHEEFLRASGDGQTLVHITRDPVCKRTKAATLPSSRTTRLLELASDVGMHPAAALSIQRAVLFVEGPLDEALIDEYRGLELDSGGVRIIPIHGTKNLEGLVAVELVTDLGIRTGILTDNTDPTTMLERAKRKRSSEEKKILDVIRIADEKGLPRPTLFGVPEADLLFALPADAIRRHSCPTFPGWTELVAECRQSLGKTQSDSVNWKSYAAERYGLHIDTPGGVRELVRALDLAGIELPSVQRVVDQIMEWATS